MKEATHARRFGAAIKPISTRSLPKILCQVCPQIHPSKTYQSRHRFYWFGRLFLDKHQQLHTYKKRWLEVGKYFLAFEAQLLFRLVPCKFVVVYLCHSIRGSHGEFFQIESWSSWFTLLQLANPVELEAVLQGSVIHTWTWIRSPLCFC